MTPPDPADPGFGLIGSAPVPKSRRVTSGSSSFGVRSSRASCPAHGRHRFAVAEIRVSSGDESMRPSPRAGKAKQGAVCGYTRVLGYDPLPAAGPATAGSSTLGSEAPGQDNDARRGSAQRGAGPPAEILRPSECQ